MTDSPGPPLAGTTIAVLGGTGPQGRGLARRFAAYSPRPPGAAEKQAFVESANLAEPALSA